MTITILIQIFLFAVALAMDAFAVSVTDGLIYQDINKKKSFFIATTFGIMQGLMPLIGFFLVEIITVIVGEAGGEQASLIMSRIITWVAFFLLIFIGVRMIIEGIKDLKNVSEEKSKLFSIKEVLIMGVATAIDALSVGVTLHTGISTKTTIWLHALIIIAVTFVISLIGLFLGKQIVKLFKDKHEITVIIGGTILVLLGLWVLLSHYL